VPPCRRTKRKDGGLARPEARQRNSHHVGRQEGHSLYKSSFFGGKGKGAFLMATKEGGLGEQQRKRHEVPGNQKEIKELVRYSPRGTQRELYKRQGEAKEAGTSQNPKGGGWERGQKAAGFRDVKREDRKVGVGSVLGGKREKNKGNYASDVRKEKKTPSQS